MQRRSLWIGSFLFCCTQVVGAASLPKARALYENHLFDDAKKELIEVAYAEQASAAERASALYLLGTINAEQDNQDLARKNWQELADRFPKSPEASLVAGKLAGPRIPEERAPPPKADSKPVSPARSSRPGVRLYSDGKEPRYLLSYKGGTTERSEMTMQMTVLDTDCPTEPAKKPYDAFSMRLPVAITTIADSASNTFVARMSGTAHVTGGGEQDATTFNYVARIAPDGAVVEILDGEKMEGQTQLALLPSIPIGVGARWEASEVQKFDGYEANFTTKYTAVAVDEREAKFEIEISITGTAEDDSARLNLEGGGKGVVVWRAGRIMPRGSNAIMFIRMVQMEGANKDQPSNTGCMLMSMATK